MPATHPHPRIRALTLGGALLTALLGSCTPPPPPSLPPPAPVRESPPTLPPPPAPPRPVSDWRAAPLTPGTWRWAMDGGASTARFADGELALRCDRAAGSITLLRRGEAQGQLPVTLLTTFGERPLTGSPAPGPFIAITFAPRDQQLDAIAFSRGRFAVEMPGLPLLIAPSWPEISRVIEDCR